MPDADYAPLIQRVLTRTQEGRIKWEPTEKDDETFVANVDKYLFITQKSSRESTISYYFRMYEGANEVLALIARKHAAGRVDQYFSALAELYDLSRRRALNIDEKLSEVLNLLDKLK